MKSLFRFGLCVSIALLSTMFAAKSVWGATIVATNGSDSTGDGSIGKPFKTIQRAMWYATPGTTIQVRGGTYYLASNEWIGNQSGTASAPITITSYPNEWAILDGSNTPVNYSAVSLAANYIVVQWLEIQNSRGFGIEMSGNHNVVHDCVIHDSWKSGLRAYNTWQTVYNCTFHDNVRINVNHDVNGWPADLEGYQCSNASFYSNTCYDNWGEGISVSK